MEQEQFAELLKKIDRVTILLALDVIRGREPEEQVAMLSAAGFQPAEIAPLIQKTPNAVSIILHKLKRKSEKDKSSPARSSKSDAAEQQQDAS